MDFLNEAVAVLLDRIAGSGCEEGVVTLVVDSSAPQCQFERGAVMVAQFGGKSAEFSTFDPIRAKTRISFLSGAVLDDPRRRGAAAVVINVAAGFFCISRRLRACGRDSHLPCCAGLKEVVTGAPVHIIGDCPALSGFLGGQCTPDAASASTVLVTADGLANPEALALIGENLGSQRIIFVGPSTAGVAALLTRETYCPYGKG
jgi:hypothetical protein